MVIDPKIMGSVRRRRKRNHGSHSSVVGLTFAFVPRITLAARFRTSPNHHHAFDYGCLRHKKFSRPPPQYYHITSSDTAILSHYCWWFSSSGWQQWSLISDSDSCSASLVVAAKANGERRKRVDVI
ncbi:hypothetical protein PIB30_067082 [Stylosanthes scabra]|uniref:Uncharacterized protein n=1 Tax=Stylosanthes scabra TaxID=79078 RepID=A0ABU6RMQ3_9FABA|nr:hypothetical protein [Stylosanthes scabra]